MHVCYKRFVSVAKPDGGHNLQQRQNVKKWNYKL